MVSRMGPTISGNMAFFIPPSALNFFFFDTQQHMVLLSAKLTHEQFPYPTHSFYSCPDLSISTLFTLSLAAIFSKIVFNADDGQKESKNLHFLLSCDLGHCGFDLLGEHGAVPRFEWQWSSRRPCCSSYDTVCL